MVGDDERITKMMRNELEAVRYTLRELQDVVVTKEAAGVAVLPITYTSIEALVKQVESLEDAIAERVAIKHGGILSRLSEDDLRTSDRILAWLLILFGVFVAMTMSLNQAGWNDPVFRIVRKVPATPYSWALLLVVSVLVYATGELVNQFRRQRGFLIIIGSLLCASWCMAMTLAMSRMVYEMPGRITSLWPMVMFFVAILYGSRAVIYANSFTGFRWTTNPYQLWGVLMIMMVSLTQIVIGVAPSSVLSQYGHQVVLQVALVDFMAASVTMFGLHLRNKEAGLNLELSGGIGLLGVLSWFCVAELNQVPLAGVTIGFAMTQAFVFATFHHSAQIIALKWARWRQKPKMARSLERALKREGEPVIVPEPVPVPAQPAVVVVEPVAESEDAAEDDKS